MKNLRIRQIIRETINEPILLTENTKWCYGKTTIDGKEHCAKTGTHDAGVDCKKTAVSGVCVACGCSDSNCNDCGEGGPAKTDPSNPKDIDMSKAAISDKRLSESYLLTEEKTCCQVCSGNVKWILDNDKPNVAKAHVKNNKDCQCCCAKTGSWACGTIGSQSPTHLEPGDAATPDPFQDYSRER